MNFNGPLNTAARLIRAVCLRGKIAIVHQSSFILWFTSDVSVRPGRKNLSSSYVVQDPRYKFKRETFVQSIFMIFFFGNLTDERADLHHVLYDTTSLST